MKHSALCFFLIGLLACQSCSWFRRPKPDLPAKQPQSIQKVQSLDPNRLREGGKLLITAFRAGPDVEANTELDKVAFMIIKGMSDEFKANNAPFTLLTVNTADQADLVLDGHITSMGRRTSWMGKLMLRRSQVKVAVEGEMIDRKSGKEIYIFSDAKEASNNKEDHKQLGEIIGQQLAKLILAEINQ